MENIIIDSLKNIKVFLAPCPNKYCNKEYDLIIHIPYYDEDSCYCGVYVVCDQCGMQGPVIDIKDVCFNSLNISEAISRWNDLPRSDSIILSKWFVSTKTISELEKEKSGYVFLNEVVEPVNYEGEY